MKKYLVIVPALLFLLHCPAQEKSSRKKSDKAEVAGVAKPPVKSINFIAMGDWGRNGEYNQKEVAIQMGMTARLADVSFILATGDNFYPSGVASTQDYSWIASYENMYTAHSLQTDWYVVLGNHDYKGNVQAEIDYSKISRRWHMPSRYYAKKISIGGDTTQQILLVCLDTSPFISQYYSSPDHQEEIRRQDTAAQKKWLESVLSDPSPNIKWKIVAGHHPLYTGGKRMESPDADELNKTLKPIFDKYKVDAYICGHEHNLQYMKPEGATHYFISGAGSETTPCILYPGIGKFAQSINGFMLFSLSANEMLVQMVDLDGNFLYRETIKK
jgi:3',5'-cyclic AMP phosphodiesterase CpdA